ncbi:DUF3068 domain-containing protein [Sphaerisporangium fuscum]|uniref:DUF3068 domain-containing protein n=1 Tax=Sphaerisporangium fuscum TaxID=2835868 RepID=UPI001BDC1A91|nr:DUF3068 domain-containing protein [Sphaerisporangium fuscum]
MRRAIGVFLLAIGAFLIVLAPLVRSVVADRLIEAPADQYNITNLTVDNGRYFSKKDLKVMSGQLDITVTTRGDVAGAKGDQVVWDQFTVVNDVTNDNRGLDMTQFRSAFNRYNGVAVNCCGANIDKEPVQIEGQVFLWPFGTEKKTYKVFNSSAHAAFDARFVGEDTVNGLPVYKFQQDVPETKIATLTAPASVLGMDQAGDVQVDRYYTGTNTFWIEPTSGAPVKQEQQRHEVLKTTDGVERLVAFDGTARMTPESVGALVKSATDAKTQINLLRSTAPLVLLVIGIVALAAGAVLIIAGRGARTAAGE